MNVCVSFKILVSFLPKKATKNVTKKVTMDPSQEISQLTISPCLLLGIQKPDNNPFWLEKIHTYFPEQSSQFSSSMLETRSHLCFWTLMLHAYFPPISVCITTKKIASQIKSYKKVMDKSSFLVVIPDASHLFSVQYRRLLKLKKMMKAQQLVCKHNEKNFFMMDSCWYEMYVSDTNLYKVFTQRFRVFYKRSLESARALRDRKHHKRHMRKLKFEEYFDASIICSYCETDVLLSKDKHVYLHVCKVHNSSVYGDHAQKPAYFNLLQAQRSTKTKGPMRITTFATCCDYVGKKRKDHCIPPKVYHQSCYGKILADDI